MKKRAMEIQFHWIFILIAGALILAFFFTVAQKQRSISQEKTAVTLSIDLDTIFSTAIESKGTAQPLPIPAQGIGFTCSKTCDCTFKVGQSTTTYGDKIIFAPELLTQQDGTAWALEFKMPFRTTNFLYLTNPRIKYYLIGDPTSLMYKQVADALPSGVLVEQKNPSEVPLIRNEGYDETRLVFVSVTNPLNINRDSFEDSHVIKIAFSGSQVIFSDKKAGQPDFTIATSSTIGTASMLAAIFSADKDMYECGMKQAFKKLSYVANVSSQRAQVLQDTTTASCSYGSAVETLDSLASAAREASQIINEAKLSSLLSIASQLESRNRALVLESCPEVY